jgi:hypothetical protein
MTTNTTCFSSRKGSFTVLRRIFGQGFAGVAALALLSGCGGDSSGTPPPPLSITAASPPTGTIGAAYPDYLFLASGGTPPLSWTESGPLPPGLVLSSTGQLSGMPATAGTYSVSVTATDSSTPQQTISTPVSVQIGDSSIAITSANPPPGTVTYPYAGFAFTASGGSPPYTWQETGTLPPGLALGTDGTVSGTPSQAGSFSFSVTATDSAQTPTTGPPFAAQILISNPSTLTVNATPVPPAGVDGMPYGPFTFSTVGGFLPLHWSISAGALPPGVALGADGSLAGTPTSVGTFAFTVRVTDSAAAPFTTSLPFTVDVSLPPPPTINSQQPPTGTVGSVYAAFQFSASNGVAPFSWMPAVGLPGGLTLSSDGLLSGTPTAAGKFPVTLNVEDALGRAAPPVPLVVRVSLPHAGTFTLLPGAMTLPRLHHAATLLLPIGSKPAKVLVTGGGNGIADATAELYDPATRTFSATSGLMTEPRIGHTATRLNNPSLPKYGSVLIVGPTDTTAELYNPVTDTFTATGSLQHGRSSPTATLLDNSSAPNYGKVLIVGGNTSSGDLTAELYDPASGTFADSGSTTVPRAGHTATLLLDGRVLIAGGTDLAAGATAEIYDPKSGSFTATGSMTVTRVGHTATRLQDGTVLVLGANGLADLFDPKGTFESIGNIALNYPNMFSRTASLRSDGTVLVAGGYSSRYINNPSCTSRHVFHTSLSVAALFAPESDGFTATGSLLVSRDGHSATPLSDNTVLVIGGTSERIVSHRPPYSRYTCYEQIEVLLSSAELFK